MRRFYWSLAVVVYLMLVSSNASAIEKKQDPPDKAQTHKTIKYFWLQSEVSASFLGEWAAASRFMGAPMYGAGVGFRLNNWDLFIHADHGFWGSGTGADRGDEQILNLGLGTGYLFFKGHMRSSVTTGPSILLTNSLLDEPGTTGFFVETKPASFRWTFFKSTVVEFCPISFSLVVPTTERIPLIHITYRTTVAIEFGL